MNFDPDDKVGPKLAAAFNEICPGVEVLDAGIFDHKRLLRLTVKSADGSTKTYEARGRIEPDTALLQVKAWAEKHQGIAS